MSAEKCLYFRILAVFVFLVTAAGAAIAQSRPGAVSATVYRSPT